jgi:hypothetical protein
MAAQCAATPWSQLKLTSGLWPFVFSALHPAITPKKIFIPNPSDQENNILSGGANRIRTY